MMKLKRRPGPDPVPIKVDEHRGIPLKFYREPQGSVSLLIDGEKRGGFGALLNGYKSLTIARRAARREIDTHPARYGADG